MCVTVDARGRSTSGFTNAHFRYSRARSRGGGSDGADEDDTDQDEDNDMADDEVSDQEAHSVEVWFCSHPAIYDFSAAGLISQLSTCGRFIAPIDVMRSGCMCPDKK